jgi:hypothetical protein
MKIFDMEECSRVHTVEELDKYLKKCGSVSENMIALQTCDHQNGNSAPKAFINILIFDNTGSE